MTFAIPMQQQDDFDEWRIVARYLLRAGIEPDMVEWIAPDAMGSLFTSTLPTMLSQSLSPTPYVPRVFVELARNVVMHRAPERWSLLYHMLVKLQRSPSTITDKADVTMLRLVAMAKAVRRDIHKMRAFVRFREVGERYVAWFEPEHHIVRSNAQFFVDRFSSMQWSILTPDLSIHWDGKILSEGSGALRGDAPDGDDAEELWKSYYASTFNPSRVKIKAMMKEMPRKYWKNMPETALVQELIAGAQKREQAMLDRSCAKDDLF